MRFLTYGIVAIVLTVANAPAQGQVTATSLSLEWTATGDDGDVGQAYRYDLRYSPSNVAGVDTLSWWTASSTRSATNLPPPSAPGQTDAVTVTGLASETTYYFIIRVFDEVGNLSPFSNIATGTTAPEIPPPPPGCTAPTATPANFQAAEDSGEVAIAWDPTSDPQATSLHLWRATGSTGTLALVASISDPNQTTYRDTNVSAGATYRYRATWAASCGDGPATASVLVTLAPSQAPPGAGVTSDAGSVHAYPNPSSGTVQLVIHVPGSSSQPARLRLYDLTGRVIADLVDGTYSPGNTTIAWPRTSRNGERVAPGYYEAIGTIGSSRVRERLLLLP